MSRRRSKKQAKDTAAAIALIWQAAVAVISMLALAVISYYKWASKLRSDKGRVAAYLTPVCLVIVASIAGLAMPSEQIAEQPAEPAYAYNHTFEDESVLETPPSVEKSTPADDNSELALQSEVEPEPYAEPELEVYIEPEPVNTGASYVSGSCKDLKARGLGPFFPGDANYTSKRDRDKDGIACE